MIDNYSTAREKMLREQIVARGVTDMATLDAILEVPRHFFVDEGQRMRAYGDYPLSITEGQTISQPYIVAYMTSLLQLTASDTVLEIGTGSGYQAAILSKICRQVYTVECIHSLLNKARKVFDSLRYFNIRSKYDDGSRGWSEFAPYDAIIVTAGSPEIPTPLLDQLADGGRMVIPVGPRYEQVLKRVTKEGDDFVVEDLAPVRFVDLVGVHGWK
ncbi:protein-L-isoaspartate(D-aspartate) O-methyltransferase [Desulfotalea psychrophila]|uniref:Protein-L-isoaspartate O-methyltransferase n=1 Tax=Desulfotalea psychrophila (strain LSv54 / DSM 12343) TaxID=177439 RepID=PIMT_DESPS|nr:protein-L-isoaspartate(D-aspartate) O-methyltransferase [Desulfotalea psychrophila]Q6ARM1.1 RecName: Full=Protein-L-isoaspartate O-methyltransferase; AltName: Full=L-isoaspartyl protein carboxyl methyltransferase; AltName: Full=Protein L-isoaspartyl methyltransferase; AltName: Full=Protein-beta-aspartate methyltransferase; Short=PIMT [Desulfotalea psychrophila LSv54]CAG35004.1 probable protein-L-isoaspartate(D-aspartate) O-methyltransferase [Desulfotalea psychrophila LSv54]